MTWQVWTIGGLAVAVLLLATYAVVLRRRVRGTAPVERVEPIAPVEPQPAAAAPAAAVEAGDEGFVITRVGEDRAGLDEPWRAPDRLVLSATLGEPLVKTVAFVHGVRRALSPANRNRIRFEVRQEVRRSRKVRRQEMRVAWRQMKAQERTQERAQEPTQQQPQTSGDVEGAA